MGLNYSGRFVRLLISHVGIDSNRWQQLSYHPNVVAKSKQIRAQHSNRKIIIGIDNLDMVKGSLLKFQVRPRFTPLACSQRGAPERSVPSWIPCLHPVSGV
jgi:trehalose-6-phosphate synthase